MDRSRFALILIILLLLAGCRRSEARVPETPTPFSSGGLTPHAPAGDPIPISLANLAKNPEFFEGAILQLHGQYQPLPKLICEGEAFPSPATWGLVGEGLQANATGLDQQLRQLVAQGQPITVDGLWLRYAGPVGCGKTAPVQEIWYLSVSRVVEPHPLARATLVAEVVTEGISEEATPIIEATAAEAFSGVDEPPTPVETATLTTTLTATPTYVPSPLPPSGPGPTEPAGIPGPLATPLTATPVFSGTAVSSTVTATATATITGTQATPTATVAGGTATPPSGTINPRGEIDFEDLVMGTLSNNAIDSWSFSIDSADSITITVAPDSEADILFSVLDSSGQTVSNRHDQAGVGGVETITDLRLTAPGTYQVHVAADAAGGADYALMVLESGSYSFVFRGTLTSGAQRSDSLAADHDHFWFFSASDGETVDLQITPNGEADAYVELYGPDGSRLTTIDDNGGGEAEILENYSVLASGLYAIRVGEFDFGSMSYQIVIDKS